MSLLTRSLPAGQSQGGDQRRGEARHRADAE